MRHLAAYYQSAQITALTTINAVADQSIFTNGVNIRVPAPLPFLGMATGAYNDATVTQLQAQSPTLRDLANFDIAPIVNGLVFPNPMSPAMLYNNPLALSPNESLNFAINANAAGAKVGYGVVEFVDGPVKPDTRNAFTIRATAAASLSAGTWVNSALTFAQTLPAGSYDVTGLRCESTNGVAARLVFIGQAWRPGCPVTTGISTIARPEYRYGGLGTWGSFDINQPPTIDVLGVTDTAQVVYLDLVKTK